MIRYMLDTNIIIYTIKNKPAIVKQKFDRAIDQLCVSTISVTELIFGAEKSAKPRENLAVVEGLINRLQVLDFDIDAANHAGLIRSDLHKVGLPIGPYDSLIAGHARSQGLVLVSNNLSEFNRVDGLRLENWAAGN